MTDAPLEWLDIKRKLMECFDKGEGSASGSIKLIFLLKFKSSSIWCPTLIVFNKHQDLFWQRALFLYPKEPSVREH